MIWAGISLSMIFLKMVFAMIASQLWEASLTPIALEIGKRNRPRRGLLQSVFELIERNGLVVEHHGNLVDDRIHEVARRADQSAVDRPSDAPAGLIVDPSRRDRRVEPCDEGRFGRATVDRSLGQRSIASVLSFIIAAKFARVAVSFRRTAAGGSC